MLATPWAVSGWASAFRSGNVSLAYLLAVNVFGLKLEIGVKWLDRLPKGRGIPDHLADGCLIVGLQPAFQGCGNATQSGTRRGSVSKLGPPRRVLP